MREHVKYFYVIIRQTQTRIRIVLWRCGAHGKVTFIAVLCKTCVLLFILEQLRLDNSSAGSNWEQLVQLDSDRS